MPRTTPALAALAFAAAIASASAWQPAGRGPIEQVFAAGGTAVLDLAAGEYRITGVQDDKLRVRWETRKPEDASRVRVHAAVDGRVARITTYGPKNGFRVAIDLPDRTDLELDLSAGELDVSGIKGNKRISAWAGEITVDAGSPGDYRRVDASVRFGELNARAFDISKGGVFRSFQWTGQGAYTLSARLFAGEITFR